MKLNFTLRAFAAVSVMVFLIYSVQRIPNLTSGFTAYYTFSKMLLNREDLGRSYDTSYFNQKINEYGISGIHDIQVNMPTNALVYLPVAWMPPKPAKTAWDVLSILYVFISVVLLLKVYDTGLLENSGLFLIILIFLWHPLYENIFTGQIYCLLLLLSVLGMYGLKYKNQLLTSSAIALCFLSKGYGVLLYPWLIFSKRYKIFFLSVLVVAGITAATFPLISMESWTSFYGFIRTSLGRGEYDSNVAYQTINGFMRHLFVYDRTFNPYPVVRISGDLVFAIVIIINLSLIVLFYIKPGKNDANHNSLLAYSSLIALSVVTAPIAEEYHYVLYIPLVAGLIQLLFKTTSLQHGIILKHLILMRTLFIVSILLMIIPFHYKSLQATEFPVYLLAYPKLYGGLILLILSFSLLGQKYAGPVTNACNPSH